MNLTTQSVHLRPIRVIGRHLLARPCLIVHTHCCARTTRVVCQAAKAKSSKARKNLSSGRKGFGPSKPAKKVEAWEEQLPPPYRVYYKPGFKPSRYLGPIELQQFEDGSVGVVAAEDVTGAELLSVSQPLAFLEGSLGIAPSVEDLHVAMLEAQLKPAVSKALSFLPRKPPAAAPAAAAPAAAVPLTDPSPAVGGSTSSSSSSEAGASESSSTDLQEQQQQQQQQQQVQQLLPDPNAPEPPRNFLQLQPSFWDEQVGTYALAKLSSRQLMRTLQASCWSEEFQDPAASQVRHERPKGFIGVWPDLAMMRHSCSPNTSCVVVDRFLLLHSTCDLEKGEEVTFNKLGSAIAAPLPVRQAAHQELFGRPCNCTRCTLEASLPDDLAQQLSAVYERAQADWPNRLQAALEGAEEAGDEETADLLAELQSEVSSELNALDDSLSSALPERDERLLVLCAVYAAYDAAWNMEELLSEEPELEKLANCVALMRLFARGSEGHVYSALLLDQAYSARAQALTEEAQNLSRKSLARQRRLTAKIQELIAAAEAAAYAYAEAITCRYGMLSMDNPQEGLIPQLEQGLSLFYAGLSALSAAQGDGVEEVPEVTRNLTIDGIPITVVDTVEGSAFAESGEEGSMQIKGQRLKVDWLEAQAEGQEEQQGSGQEQLTPMA